MVPLTSEFVEISSVARNEVARQTPGGGLRSPAARALTSQAVDPIAVPPLLPAAGAAEKPREGGQDAHGTKGPKAAEVEGVPDSPLASARVESGWARVRGSVWTPIVVKAGAASVALSCLAFAGAAALPRDPAGVDVGAVGTEWIAGGDDASNSFPVHTAADHSSPKPPAEASGSKQVSPHVAGTASEQGDSIETNERPCKRGDAASGEASASGASAGVASDGRIVLNAASADELTRLPGVGKKRAEQIVALRERLGGKFKRISDLLRVKGIGPKSLRRLTPLLVLDPPAEEAGS